MASVQCKMCGYMVELPDGLTVGECPACGSVTTFPKIASEHAEQLYARAEHFRQINDFDKAIDAYEAIVREQPEDAEAYWGIVLSRFGIEYVEDPVSHERVPTCHRVQYESILADGDYRSALENADAAQRDVYEAEAKRIAEIQKGILAISAQEKPFDVFICYKEVTEGGSRTKDSAIAQDIYYQLANEGYKVFFARITLEDKLGQQYEPYIFAALNSAKVMLVVGTRKEHFNAVWVRNEWSRFLALMKKDRSRLLIPCYRDMDAYDIPEELSMLQSQDMSKIGFVQDLLRGIEKLVRVGKPTKAVEAPMSSGVEPLIKRIRLFLESEEFEQAKEYCERVLDKEPENAEAYLLRLLAECEVSSEKQLKNVWLDKNNKTFLLFMKFANEGLKQRIMKYMENIESASMLCREKTVELDEQLKSASTVTDLVDILKASRCIIESTYFRHLLPNDRDCLQKILVSCTEKINGQLIFHIKKIDEAVKAYVKTTTPEVYQAVASTIGAAQNEAKIIRNFIKNDLSDIGEDFKVFFINVVSDNMRKLEGARATVEEQIKEERYQTGLHYFNIAEYSIAEKIFEGLGDFKDSKEKYYEAYRKRGSGKGGCGCASAIYMIFFFLFFLIISFALSRSWAGLAP